MKKYMILVIALVFMLTGCTPTAEVTPTPDPMPTAEVTPTPDPAPAETPIPGAMTEEELQWFEEVYFRPGLDNMHNAFISGFYGRPQDIDLYELFYDGSHLGGLTEATTAEVDAAYPDQRPDCPVYRVTCGEMNEVLLKYTGLTLEETNQVGLDKLPYLEEYDAYYWSHGDVGGFVTPIFLSGVREGSTVKLYYRPIDTLLRLTLKLQSKDNYRFVSNLPVSEDTLSEFDTNAAREMEEIYGQITEDDQFTMTLILDGNMAGSYPVVDFIGLGRITGEGSGYAGEGFGYVWYDEFDTFGMWLPESTDQLIFSGGEQSLVFYNYGNLVEHRKGETSRWYRAVQTDDDVVENDLYHFLRRWYDGVEVKAIQKAIAIPDDGRTADQLARAWVEAYEGAHLQASPGSWQGWTYLKVAFAKESEDNIPAFEDLDENTVPIVWSTIFVPEIDNGNNFMAGNTEYYTGDDPEVPRGALQWWSVGYLHRGEDGLWRCDGGGTGW